MNAVDKRAMTWLFAKRLTEMRDMIDGMTFLKNGQVLTLDELCDIGADAIQLIREGKI